MRCPVSIIPIAWRNGIWRCSSSHAAVQRQAPDQRLGQAEARLVAGDDEVAAQHHLEAAAEREAVDARDHRHVQRLAQRDAAEAAGPRRGPVVDALEVRGVLQVRADAERALAGAGQHHDAHVVVAARCRPRCACSSASVARSIAFSTSGRSIVTVATWFDDLAGGRSRASLLDQARGPRPAPRRCAAPASAARGAGRSARPTCGSGWR